MTRGDDSILEFLYNAGNWDIISTPGVIEMNIEFSESTVKSRIRILHEEGLVEYWDEDRGAYQITEKGKKYLRGELDAADLEGDIGD